MNPDEVIMNLQWMESCFFFCFFFLPDCYSYKDVDSCKAKNNSVYFNKTCYNATAAQELNIVYLDASKRRSPAEEYFEWVFIEFKSPDWVPLTIDSIHFMTDFQNCSAKHFRTYVTLYFIFKMILCLACLELNGLKSSSWLEVQIL